MARLSGLDLIMQEAWADLPTDATPADRYQALLTALQADGSDYPTAVDTARWLMGGAA